METIITILNYIDVGAPLLTLFFFLKPFKRLSRELLFIFCFVCIQFITNLVASILEFMKLANYFMYAANIILSFFCLVAMFYKVINKIMDRLIIFALVAFAVCAVVSISSGDGISTYNSALSAIASLVITIFCLVYFYWKLVSDTRMTRLTENSFFWIIIGIFTYYTGSFFIFISYKYLIVQETGAVGILWRFHNILLTMFCIYTMYGLACKNYQKT